MNLDGPNAHIAWNILPYVTSSSVHERQSLQCICPLFRLLQTCEAKLHGGSVGGRCVWCVGNMCVWYVCMIDVCMIDVCDVCDVCVCDWRVCDWCVWCVCVMCDMMRVSDVCVMCDVWCVWWCEVLMPFSAVPFSCLTSNTHSTTSKRSAMNYNCRYAQRCSGMCVEWCVCNVCVINVCTMCVCDACVWCVCDVCVMCGVCDVCVSDVCMWCVYVMCAWCVRVMCGMCAVVLPIGYVNCWMPMAVKPTIQWR